MHPWIRTVGIALAAFLVTAALLTRLTGSDEMNSFVPFLHVALWEGIYALVWWLAALGFGLGLMRFAVGPSVRMINDAARAGALSSDVRSDESTTLDELAVAFTLGAAFLLALDSALGSLGLLLALQGGVAWGVLLIGLIIGVRILRLCPLERDADAVTPHMLLTVAIGALTALLAVAASSAPGWLWSSEFGGFDALSYHLMLPRTWLTTQGAIGPVDGNVYSALPSFVEAAFAHLMVLRHDTLAAAYACQWWAALCTVITAFVVARLARNTLGAAAGATTALLFLGVPWIIVIGSLAYNDIAPCLFLAGGWLIIIRSSCAQRPLDARAAAALALVAAAAVGAKPTAFFFTALPLLAIVLMHNKVRVLRFAPLVVALALVVLSPWLVRNTLHYGNPLFPFATTMFGSGPWNETQVAIFSAAHSAQGSLMQRLPLFVEQFLAHGFGSAPTPSEPWFPQWSVLPALGILGLGLASRRNTSMRTSAVVLAIICVSWMLFTHGKSRFLAPAAVPLALGTASLLRSFGTPWLERHTLIATLLICAFPFVVFMREPDKGEPTRAPAAAIDAIAQLTGEPLARAIESASGDERNALMSLATTPLAVNFMLPPNAKVIGIGYTTPFYILRAITTTTVWDRGDFDRIAESSPGTPATWGRDLAALGYTHAIINPTMLDNWTRNQWLNPALATGGWQNAFAESNRPLLRTGSGEVIFELKPRMTDGAR